MSATLPPIPPPPTDPLAIPLTEEEIFTFKDIRQSPDTQIGLLRILYQGRPTAAICAVEESSNGGWDIFPLAIFTDQEMFEDITPPAQTAEIPSVRPVLTIVKEEGDGV